MHAMRSMLHALRSMNTVAKKLSKVFGTKVQSFLGAIPGMDASALSGRPTQL